MTDSVDNLVTKVAGLLDQLSGPGVQTAIEATRVTAYSALVGGAFCLVVAVACLFGVRKLWPIEPKDYLDIPFAKIAAGILFLVAVSCLLVAIWSVADPWVWVTIQHPELRLAKQLLNL